MSIRLVGYEHVTLRPAPEMQVRRVGVIFFAACSHWFGLLQALP